MKYLKTIVLVLMLSSFMQAQSDTIYFSSFICLDGSDSYKEQSTCLIVNGLSVSLTNSELNINIRLVKKQIEYGGIKIKLLCDNEIVLHLESDKVVSAFLFGDRNYYFMTGETLQ